MSSRLLPKSPRDLFYHCPCSPHNWGSHATGYFSVEFLVMFHIWCGPGAHCRRTQFLAVQCVSIFNDVSRKALFIVNKASGDVLCCILIVFVTLKKLPRSGMSMCPRGTQCAPGAHCRGTQFLAVQCVSIFNDVSRKALFTVNKASGDVLCCILIVFVTL